MYNYNWNNIYEKCKGMISLTDCGDSMQEGRDYEIIDICHTDNEVHMTIEGRGNYGDRREAVFRIEHNAEGQPVIRYGGDTQPVTDTAAIPQRVRVGDKLYSTVRGPAYVRDGAVYLGQCDYAAAQIFVSEVDNADCERLVFIHELTHAIIDRYCGELELPLTHEQNEAFTEAFARGLWQCIKDNPHVFVFEAGEGVR